MHVVVQAGDVRRDCSDWLYAATSTGAKSDKRDRSKLRPVAVRSPVEPIAIRWTLNVRVCRRPAIGACTGISISTDQPSASSLTACRQLPSVGGELGFVGDDASLCHSSGHGKL
jgi:hypothetical protein